MAALLGPWALGPPGASAGAGDSFSPGTGWPEGIAVPPPRAPGWAAAPRPRCSPPLDDTPAAVGVLGAQALCTGRVAQALLHGKPEHLGQQGGGRGCGLQRRRASWREGLPWTPDLTPPGSLSLKRLTRQFKARQQGPRVVAACQALRGPGQWPSGRPCPGPVARGPREPASCVAPPCAGPGPLIPPSLCKDTSCPRCSQSWLEGPLHQPHCGAGQGGAGLRPTV